MSTGPATDADTATLHALHSRVASRLMQPIEAISAALLSVIVVLLLTSVVARYVFSLPVVWVDEIVSLSFLWLAMLGSVIAMHRNEHLRLTLVVEKVPPAWRGYVQGFALAAVAATLMASFVGRWRYVQHTEMRPPIEF